MFKRTFVFCTLLLSLIIFTSIFQENNIQFNNITSGNINTSLLDCNGPDTVYFTIHDSLRINNAKLFWSKNFNPWDSSVMVKTGANTWRGIMMLTGIATYRYYVKTVDSLGRIGTMPAGAPANYYSFICPGTDTIKPVITHTPIGNTPRAQWPATVTASVTDNSGIDSVWVRWKRNTAGITKQFKLINTSGNIYSAVFNSIQADVSIGDTIRYRIIAQDISTYHNKDSTALYSFVIIAQNYNCIGNGSVLMNSSNGTPFNTVYWGCRTQILLTSQEIYPYGSVLGFITGIGFYVSSSSSQTMNGFNIKMQKSNITSLLGFVNNGWDNVYTGNYTMTGTGLQFITLQTPFLWSSPYNLIIEICFGNTSSSTETILFGSSISNMEVSEYHNIQSACNTFSSPVVQTSRPNICLQMWVEGVNNIKSLAEKYYLSQNYPNPFNPVSRINFDIAKSGNVNLKIYDVLGREVKTLVNEFKSTGSYSVDFDATDFSSGVYFYKIDVNDFSDVKRMILIK